MGSLLSDLMMPPEHSRAQTIDERSLRNSVPLRSYTKTALVDTDAWTHPWMHTPQPAAHILHKKTLHAQVCG